MNVHNPAVDRRTDRENLSNHDLSFPFLAKVCIVPFESIPRQHHSPSIPILLHQTTPILHTFSNPKHRSSEVKRKQRPSARDPDSTLVNDTLRKRLRQMILEFPLDFLAFTFALALQSFRLGTVGRTFAAVDLPIHKLV
jgi:hypothetical protein